MNPAATSPDGVPAAGCERARKAACAELAGPAGAAERAAPDAPEAPERAPEAPERAAEAAAAGGTSGPTSVPTGVTFPSALNPQFSRLSAELISVSAGQCSSVTMSVTPFRLAIPM